MVVADGAVEGRVVVLLSAKRRVGAPPQQRATHVHAPHPRAVARAHQRRLSHLVARVDVGAVPEEKGDNRGETRATRPVQRGLTEAVSARDVGAVLHKKLRHLQHIHKNQQIINMKHIFVGSARAVHLLRTLSRRHQTVGDGRGARADEGTAP